MNVSCLRQHGSRFARALGFDPHLVPVLAAVIFLSACASVRPAIPPSDPALVGALITDRLNGGRYFAGWVEGVFDAAYASGSICPGPLTVAEVEALVFDAIREAPPEIAAIVPVRAAFLNLWPCPAQPTDSRNFAASAV